MKTPQRVPLEMRSLARSVTLQSKNLQCRARRMFNRSPLMCSTHVQMLGCIIRTEVPQIPQILKFSPCVSTLISTQLRHPPRWATKTASLTRNTSHRSNNDSSQYLYKRWCVKLDLDGLDRAQLQRKREVGSISIWPFELNRSWAPACIH